MCFTVLIIPYEGANVKGLRHNNFEYVWCGTIVQSVQSWLWVGFLWNVTSGGVWSWWVCTKRCVERFGFLRETEWGKVGQVEESGCVQVGRGVGSELAAETTVGSGFAGRRW